MSHITAGNLIKPGKENIWTASRKGYGSGEVMAALNTETFVVQVCQTVTNGDSGERVE